MPLSTLVVSSWSFDFEMVGPTGTFLTSLDSTPDNGLIGGGNSVFRIDPSTGMTTDLLTEDVGDIGAVAVDPISGNIFAILGIAEPQSLVAFDAVTGMLVGPAVAIQGPNGSAINGIDFTPTGELIVSAGGLFEYDVSGLDPFNPPDDPLMGVELNGSSDLLQTLGATELGDIDISEIGGELVLTGVTSGAGSATAFRVGLGDLSGDVTAESGLGPVFGLAVIIPSPAPAGVLTASMWWAGRRRRRDR
ncbi:MAG: hypothetical protein AAGI30_05510 [Planctomycetota bacterium]